MAQFNVGDIISFPSSDELTVQALKCRTVCVTNVKVSKRKTIKIKKFLWFKDITITYSSPSKKESIPMCTFIRK